MAIALAHVSTKTKGPYRTSASVGIATLSSLPRRRTNRFVLSRSSALKLWVLPVFVTFTLHDERRSAYTPCLAVSSEWGTSRFSKKFPHCGHWKCYTIPSSVLRRHCFGELSNGLEDGEGTHCGNHHLPRNGFHFATCSSLSAVRRVSRCGLLASVASLPRARLSAVNQAI